MNPDNERKLQQRIAQVGNSALARAGYVTAVDVLVGIGWLDPPQVERWRRGQVPYLERVAGANLKKLGTALRIFARWADSCSLLPSEAVYVSWTKDRHPLRFSKSGDPNIERAYRTHRVSPALSKRKASN